MNRQVAYPLIVFARQDPALSMMFSLYVTLGVFLLLAIRDPRANRSLIALAPVRQPAFIKPVER
jgi:hypothetical protein